MKGITPVLSLILLIIIVIVVVGFSFFFFPNIFSSTQEIAEEQISSQTEELGYCLRIESISDDKIYIRNCGSNVLTDIDVTTEGITIPVISFSETDSDSIGEAQVNFLVLEEREYKIKVSAGIISDYFYYTPHLGLPAFGEKNMGSYPPGNVFLISDVSWRDVLQLVPLTIWRNSVESCDMINHGTEMCAYPLLVYHDEGSFDADSVIHFMQQYNTQDLTVFGTIHPDLDLILLNATPFGAGLTPGQIQYTTIDNYFSYWTNYSDILLVDYDNYESGLLASVYASYFNIPLIFVDENNLVDYENKITGKRVTVVGDIHIDVMDFLTNASSVETMTDDEVRSKYKILTNSDKVILTNPDDIEDNYVDLGVYGYWSWDQILVPDKVLSTDPQISKVDKTYYKNSLFSPFLAAGKEEIIFTTHETEPDLIQEDFSSDYLTIFPENEENKFICNAEDACSTHFKNTAKEVYYGEDELNFTINITDFHHNGDDKTYYYRFGFMGGLSHLGYFFDCSGEKTNLTILINGVQVEKQYNVTCEILDEITFVEAEANILNRYSYEDVFLANDAGVLPDYLLKINKIFNSNVLNGNGIYTITLKFPGSKLSFSNISLMEWEINADEMILGSCAAEEDCMENIDSHEVYDIGEDASTPGEFHFSVPQRDYTIKFNVTVNFESMAFDLYVNGELFKEFSKDDFLYGAPKYYSFERIVFIPKEKVTNPLTISFSSDSTPSAKKNKYIIYSADLTEIKETGFLTIFASPNIIKDYKSDNELRSDVNVTEIDNYKYSKLSGSCVNFATGRIYGITPSDTSAYVARSLFLDKIEKNSNALFLLRGLSEDYNLTWLKEAFLNNWTIPPEDIFDKVEWLIGFNETNTLLDNATLLEKYSNNSLVVYVGHGFYTSLDNTIAYSKTLQDLSLRATPFMFSAYSCETCSFYYAYAVAEKQQPTWMFCVQNMRRGAILFEGAAGPVKGAAPFAQYFSELYVENKTLSEVYRFYKNKYIDRNNGFSLYFFILGDPTIKPRWW